MHGRVHFWEDRVLYVGPDVPSGLHAHHAVQVCVSLSDPIRYRTSPHAAWQSIDGAIIPSDVPHQTYPQIPLLATFWLDAETSEAQRMVGHQSGPTIQPIAASRLRVLVPLLRAIWERGDDDSQAALLLDEAIRILAPRVEPRPTPPLDARVARARDLLRSAPSRHLPAADLAAAVGLSPSRLRHLLRPHLGIPMRRYLLWLRLRDAVRELAHGATITASAHAAGFADAPHLDRTFRRMLGFTPSVALRVSQFVQDARAAPR